MVFLTLSALFGLGLGFLSFYQQKLCLGLSIGLIGAAKSWFLITVFLGRPLASEFSPTGQSEGIIMDIIYLYQALFRNLPESLQLALFLLPAFVIVGRSVTWAHYKLFPDSALPLTEAELHAQTMNKFSYKKR